MRSAVAGFGLLELLDQVTRLGISRDEEERCLRVLEDTGQIRRRGARYEAVQGITGDTRPDAAAERGLKQR